MVTRRARGPVRLEVPEPGRQARPGSVALKSDRSGIGKSGEMCPGARPQGLTGAAVPAAGAGSAGETSAAGKGARRMPFSQMPSLTSPPL